MDNPNDDPVIVDLLNNQTDDELAETDAERQSRIHSGCLSVIVMVLVITLLLILTVLIW
jgi:uncharacterized protein YqhQ